MRWIERFADALSDAGVRGRTRRRILLELADHIACDPDCETRLGDPAELAATFADELATEGARRSAFSAFGALAAAAVALLASQAHGFHPGFDAGLSIALFIPALLGMIVAPQVAFVAGILATLRAARHRRARTRPAAELALIRKRAWVALGGGFATVAGLLCYAADFALVLPAWWVALVAGSSLIAGCGLAAAASELARTGTIVSRTPGRAGDIFDDIPFLRLRWLERRPWLLGVLGSLGATLAITVLTGHAERSLLEGLQRGAFEGLAAGLGFVLLGRAIGIPPTADRTFAMQTDSPIAGHLTAGVERLASDADRSWAEDVLRDGFAQGRLTVDELGARAAAVHGARTITQLRYALTGLLD